MTLHHVGPPTPKYRAYMPLPGSRYTIGLFRFVDYQLLAAAWASEVLASSMDVSPGQWAVVSIVSRPDIRPGV
jgi:hypothetical protein